MPEPYVPPIDPQNPPYVVTKSSYPPGGNGRNQGRHRRVDRGLTKKQIPIGVRRCDITELGGEDAVKRVMSAAIEAAILEKKKGG